MFKLIFGYIKKIGSAVGITWSALEVLGLFFSQIKEEAFKQRTLILVMAVSAVWILSRGIYLTMFSTYRMGDLKIKIRFGDILEKKKCTIVAGVNRELITDEKKLGRNSIHRQLVLKGQGHEELFEEKRKELAQEGKDYAPMGTILQPDEHLLFLVMTTLKANKRPETNREDIRKALRVLFNQQKDLEIESNHLCIPVLGTGSAGVRMSYMDVMLMTINEYIIANAKEDQSNPNRIKTLEIVVYWNSIFQGNLLLNWPQFQGEVKMMINLCGNCPSLP